MKKLSILGALCIVIFASVLFPTKFVEATETQTPTCNWSNLVIVPHPDPSNWNHTGEFQVTNTASYPMTFDWLLDMWGFSSQNKSGSTTLNPGETKVYGFGNICPKWQFDVTCDGKEWGAIVESNPQACQETQPSPTSIPERNDEETNETTDVTPTPTTVSDVAPTGTSSQGKQTSLSTNVPSCEEQISATSEITNNGQGVSDINVVFTYHGDVKNEKTGKDGKATVHFAYQGDAEITMQPEQGYASQRKSIYGDKTKTCIGGGDVSVLGATTMADTGTVKDSFAILSGILGVVFAATGITLYAKRSF